MIAREWLYYRVYPGRLEAMEPLLRTAVADAVACISQLAGIDRWFFVRYVDYRGYHVRLRFSGTLDAINALQTKVEHLLTSSLAGLRNLEPRPVRALVPLPIPSLVSEDVGYALDLYEPEYEVYGGKAGVQIAERLFQVSSELALEIVAEADRSDVEPRIPLALLMMMTTAETWLVAERPGFWDRYATFWSGGDEAAALRWRESLRTGAARRGRVVREHCWAIMGDERIRRLVDRYRVALQKAFYAYQVDFPELDQESLCSQLIHLMNNRLGIFPFEEAYMALLAEHLI